TTEPRTTCKRVAAFGACRRGVVSCERCGVARDGTGEAPRSPHVLPAGAAAQWRRRAGPGPRACGRALKPLGPEKAGEVAGEAGGFGDEAALEARQAIDEAEAEVARGADQHPVVGEQLVQAV